MTEKQFLQRVAVWFVLGTILIVVPAATVGRAEDPVVKQLLWGVLVFGSGVLGGVVRLLQMRIQSSEISTRLERGSYYETMVGGIVALGVYALFSTKQVTIFSPDNIEITGGPEFGRCVFLGLAAGYLWEILLARLFEQVKAKGGD